MTIKTAATRLCRAGLEAANEGDFAAAASLVKTGYYIAQGYDVNDVIENVFGQEHTKIAEAAIEDIVSTPSAKLPNVNIAKVLRFIQQHPDLIGAGVGTAAGGALGYQRNGLAGAGLGAAAGGGGGYLLGRQLKPRQ
jgi:uncharacterized protein YcfJ